VTVKETAALLGPSAEAVEVLSASKQEPTWMRDKRRAAWQLSTELSMPSGNEEAWRRTDLRGLKWESYHPIPPILPSAGSHGREAVPTALSPHLGLPETTTGGILLHGDGSALWGSLDEALHQQGLIFCDLDTAVQQHADLVEPHFMTSAVPVSSNIFTAMHGALWNGGTFLYVPRGAQVTLPLQTLTAQMTSLGMLHPHTLLIADEQSHVTLVEEQFSGSDDLAGLHNGVVELCLKAGAHVTYLHMQNWGRRLWGIAHQGAALAADSRLCWASAGLGSRLHWTGVNVQLREPGSQAKLFGLMLTDGRQHLDYQTLQDHQAPHTESDLTFKNALLGRSRTVFRGVVWLHPEAQQTAAYQSAHALLLSSQARADAIPILEIEADDVRCKHGATTGRIDDDHMFYLMSRGLSYQEAQRMIVSGFLETVVTEFPVEGFQEKIRMAVDARI
jgi:Fe-S cluster assembly protein SufD